MHYGAAVTLRQPLKGASEALLVIEHALSAKRDAGKPRDFIWMGTQVVTLLDMPLVEIVEASTVLTSGVVKGSAPNDCVWCNSVWEFWKGLI